MSPWIWAAVGAGWLYGAFGIAMYLRQRKLLYRSDPSDIVPVPIDGHWPQVIATTASDGVACRHLWWPPKDRRAAVVALCHGNSGHAGHRIDKLAPLVGAGQGLLLVGYRGYGGNPGKPTQAGLIADAAAAVSWLEEKVGSRPVVLYGESLGAAVAVQLAVAGHADALVIECPFDRLATAAARRYPWFPMKNMLRDPWDSLAVIGGLRKPLLWLHGSEDEITPLDLGERLYAAVTGPKQQMVIQGAGHCDFLDRPEVMRRLMNFLADVPRRLTARTAAQP